MTTVPVGIPWLDILLRCRTVGDLELRVSRHRRCLVEQTSEPSVDVVVATIMKNMSVVV